MCCQRHESTPTGAHLQQPRSWKNRRDLANMVFVTRRHRCRWMSIRAGGSSTAEGYAPPFAGLAR
jgi:hypothetical protein